MREEVLILKSNCERGAAMVEFALIVSFFTLLVFAIIQWGLIFFESISLKQATAIGTREAVLNSTPGFVNPCVSLTSGNPTNAQVAACEAYLEPRILAALPPGAHHPTAAEITVTHQVVDAGRQENSIQVQIITDFPVLIPIRAIVPNMNNNGTVTLTVTTEMR